MAVKSNQALLNTVVEISRLAAKAILAVYNDHAALTVTHKADQSPLTKADQLAHNIIVQALNELTPKITVVSEESNTDVHTSIHADDCFWLVDPLDGTKEFIDRNGEFTVNIALVKERQVVLGVVNAPALNTCYYAAKGIGAFKQAGQNPAEKLQLQTKTLNDQPLRLTTSRRHGLDSMQAFIEKIGPCQCINMGSSLKICLLAEGAADLYPRLGPTKEWDTAAAQCVLEQAGGKLLSPSGKSLDYSKQDLLNPKFLALGARGSAAWTTHL
ncbi:MAG: 3'(2'),5'-bisphosphate nucleotidase CysQ [Gammaproteobacteria bacterium]|nr:3'(2'),5'-bisphosphate nucleotidase CysQ [Gammaproteobacteria bacterium]